MSLSALSESVTTRVYRYLLQRTLNLVVPEVFLILTAVGAEEKKPAGLRGQRRRKRERLSRAAPAPSRPRRRRGRRVPAACAALLPRRVARRAALRGLRCKQRIVRGGRSCHVPQKFARGLGGGPRGAPSAARAARVRQARYHVPRASGRRAVMRKSLISLICFGCGMAAPMVARQRVATRRQHWPPPRSSLAHARPARPTSGRGCATIFFFRRALALARSARGSPPRASPRDHRDAPRASRARIGRHSEPLEPAPRRRARVVHGRRLPRHRPTPTLARAQPPQNQRRGRKRKKKKKGREQT